MRREDAAARVASVSGLLSSSLTAERLLWWTFK